MAYNAEGFLGLCIGVFILSFYINVKAIVSEHSYKESR